MNICVLQVDSRNELFGNFSLCASVNIKQCLSCGFDYKFKKIEPLDHLGCCYRYAKIKIISKIIQSNSYDSLVFLDTDAWIQQPSLLRRVIEELLGSSKIGCFSREPAGGVGLLSAGSCFVNSGSFALKCCDEAVSMLHQISMSVDEDIYKNKRFWPNDQLHISNYVYKNRNKFYIFKDYVLNTPKGLVLRHNWFKDVNMQRDLEFILDYKFLPEYRSLKIVDFLDSSDYTGPYKGSYRII